MCDIGADCGLAEFLASRPPGVHLVAPEPVLARLAECAPKARLTRSTQLVGVPPAAGCLIVHDPDNEPALIAAARQAYPRRLVLGLLQHVLPGLSLRRPIQLPQLLKQDGPLPEHRYAVICTPRTGSTFLCELLQAGGLGAPREHLRVPLVHACGHRTSTATSPTTWSSASARSTASSAPSSSPTSCLT